MGTRVRPLGLGLVIGLGVLSGCGSAQAPAAPPAVRASDAGAAPGLSAAAVPKDPSVSAKMICAKDEQGEVADGVGLPLSGPATQSWVAPDYTCTYPFKAGRLVLSVRELANPADTTAYFNGALATSPGSIDIPDLGDGAFAAKDGSVYVRKDFKVLRVDVRNLPRSVGEPPISRADVAVRVAVLIMGCWTGQ